MDRAETVEKHVVKAWLISQTGTAAADEDIDTSRLEDAARGAPALQKATWKQPGRRGWIARNARNAAAWGKGCRHQ